MAGVFWPVCCRSPGADFLARIEPFGFIIVLLLLYVPPSLLWQVMEPCLPILSRFLLLSCRIA